MTKQNNFIVDVVPLTRIPLSRQQYFSYLSKEKIPQGALVIIPLFKRELRGIVLKNRQDFERVGNIKLKYITKIVENNYMDENQFRLAEFISDYYLSPTGVALKLFSPRITKSRKLKKIISPLKIKKINLTTEQKKAVSEITKKNSNFPACQDPRLPGRHCGQVALTGRQIPNSKFLLFGPASSGKTEVYLNSMKEILNKEPGSQFLVLLPEIILTPQAIDRYSQYFKKNEIAVLTSKVSKGEFYESWRKIKAGKIKLIVGTRMAVFAPFRNLKIIFIDEEQDISFKQWNMNPRYDARTAAEKLAEIHRAKIVLGSATPRIESFHKALNKEYELLKLPDLKIKTERKPKIDVEIVDMKKERWENNKSFLSNKLKDEIDFALKNKMQTILFVSRRGMNNFSICANCRTVLRCPRCKRALIYTNKGVYRCLHCSYESEVFIICSKCKGMVFKNYGVGTQKIEKEIKNIFPGARVKRADLESMKNRKDIEELYANLSSRKIDILIGTQMITKGWDLKGVGLIGIMDADALLSFPDFRSDEKAYQLISQVIGRAGRTGSKFSGKAMIQTFQPENKVMKYSSEMNFEKFYKEKIADRKSLRYPPFIRLVKITFINSNPNKVEKETEKLYHELIARLEKFKTISIARPQYPLPPKIRDNYRKQIVIKIKNIPAGLPPELKKILTKLNNNWIIDVDPISII